MTTENIKYLGINLKRSVQNLYEENFKIYPKCTKAEKDILHS